MKKIMVVLFILVILFISSSNNASVVIPKESIRFRVIANSNSKEDQKDKKIIAKNLALSVNDLLSSSNNIEDSRNLITKNIPKIENNIKSTIKKNNIKTGFSIKYGNNYFPEKKYKGVVYKEGDYESLVVTLGKGKGKNFWCVLFPSLCLLETEEKSENVNYTSYVKEQIDKYF